MSQNIPFPFGGQSSVAPPPNNIPQVQTPNMGGAPSAGGDMASLLASMNITPDQLAKIAYLMQTGQLTLPPPPPPTLPVTTPSAPPPAQTHPVPATDPRLKRQAPAQDVDMDKEDGEVEDGELEDAPEPEPRDFLRTPPKGPRKRSRSPLPRFPNAQDSRRNSQQQQPQQRQPSPRPANAQRRTPALNMSKNASVPALVNGNLGAARKAARNAAAKEVVMHLHSHGYSFDDVAKAVSNMEGLRRVYNQLGLPAASPKPAPARMIAKSAAQAPVVDTQCKVSQPKKIVAAKPATVDRSAYLAKLQAAKNKKAEPAAASASPVEKPIASSAAAKPPPSAPLAAVPALAEKVASKNDLIRQRMAALAAERAAKEDAKRKAAEAVANSDVVVISSDDAPLGDARNGAKHGLGDGPALEAVRASGLATNGGSTPTPHSLKNLAAQSPPLPQPSVPQQIASPTLNRGFGLPGLFTTSSPLSPASFQQQQTAAFAPPPPPLVQSRPQSASTFNTSTAQKRPYGQINGDDEDRVVIVDSDEDDSDDDMDIDEDDAPGNASVLIGGAPAPGYFEDFPPRPTLSKLVTSVPGTPGTPGTPSQASLKMDQEIAEMKRRIAEAESRKRRKTGSTGQAQLIQGVVPSQPASQAMTPSAEAAVTDKIQATLSHSTDASRSSSLREQRQLLEQRLRDLQAQGIGTGLKSPPTQGTDANVNAPTTDALTDAQPAGVDQAAAVLNGRRSPTDVLEDVHGEDGEIEDDYEPDFDLAANADGQTAMVSAIIPPHSHSHRQASENVNDSGAHDGASATAVPSTIHETNGLVSEHITSIAAHSNPATQQDDDQIDDDDLDDIYADPAGSATEHNVQMPAPATTTEPDDDQDETDDAMDMSGDSSDSDSDENESEGEYEPELGPANTNAVHERQTTSSELNHGADLQMRLEAEQSSSASSEDDSSSSASSPAVGASADDMEPDNTNTIIAEANEGTITDAIAPELQPVVEEPVVPRDEFTLRKSSFEPYQSPLVRFKDFRYHPEFNNTISGGHRSLTYSNSIDPEKVLCPFEAAGEACEDATCTHQHFKDMPLSDNDLLRLIGADRTPARTPEELQRWKNGLTAVVQRLRETNVGKDVECIATRIAEYRREFLGDPTKTLLLK